MTKQTWDVLNRMTPDQAKSKAKRASQTAVMHLLCMLYFVQVIAWHFTDAAKPLPGATGFGWFYKYFTFCSFTLQALQFIICALDDASWQGEKRPLKPIADVLSCSMFCSAQTVTTMFYAMQYLTNGQAEEPSIHRPKWLSPTVHIYNAAAAWGDIIMSEQRSFSPASLALNLVLGVLYAAWLLLVRSRNGKFPYPFLNRAKQPHAFIATYVACSTFMLVWFYLGAWARKALHSLWEAGARWLEAKASSLAEAAEEDAKKRKQKAKKRA